MSMIQQSQIELVKNSFIPAFLTSINASEKSDEQLRHILRGMGVSEEHIYAALYFYRNLEPVKAVEPQTIENKNNTLKMKFTTLRLHEKLTECLTQLHEQSSGTTGRTSYSASQASYVLERILESFPLVFKGNSKLDESIEQGLDATLKFSLAAHAYDKLSTYSWLNSVSNLRTWLNEQYEENKWHFKINNAYHGIGNVVGSSGLYETLKTDLYSILSENTSDISTKFKVIAAKHTWSRECKAIVNEMLLEEGQIIETNENVVFKPVSVVLVENKDTYFSLYGTTYSMNENVITKKSPKNYQLFNTVQEGLDLFKVIDSSLVYFGDKSTHVSYSLTENKLTINKIDYTNKSIVEIKEALTALGAFTGHNIANLHKVLIVLENAHLVKEIPNVTTINSGKYKGLSVSLLPVNEGLYIFKLNTGMQLIQHELIESATDAVKIVNEFINHDISPIVRERLVSENNQEQILIKKRLELNEKLDFIASQILKVEENLTSIGENQTLRQVIADLSEEQNKIEKELQMTFEKSSKDYLNDGYIQAKMLNTTGKIKKGQDVYAKAEDLTSLGELDSLIVIDMKGDSHQVIKKDIEVNLK